MENTIQKEIDSLNKQVGQQKNLLLSVQKVTALQTKLLLEENASHEKNDRLEIKEMRYIGVEFEYQKVAIGQRLINEALKEGFQPQRDYERGSGIVMVMAKWGPKDAVAKTE
jgi:hypothetical protein